MANIFAANCLMVCIANINPSTVILLFDEDNSPVATKIFVKMIVKARYQVLFVTAKAYIFMSS